MPILCSAATQRDTGPQPPCGVEVSPPYPRVDDSPTTRFWEQFELGRNWLPPACIGWTTHGFATLVVTVGRFRNSSGFDGVRRRLSAISDLKGTRYWSTTHKQWQTLIDDAYATTGPPAYQRRKDFSLDEIVEGASLYFRQADNLSGTATYHLRIFNASPDRIVFNIENITTMRYFLIPLFQPGEMQSVHFIERESQEIWRYYSIARTGKNASSLAAGHEASSINRAVAFFRYLAGIPTDKEPPAMR
jgi:Family of unknown function (DUF6675)